MSRGSEWLTKSRAHRASANIWLQTHTRTADQQTQLSRRPCIFVMLEQARPFRPPPPILPNTAPTRGPHGESLGRALHVCHVSASNGGDVEENSNQEKEKTIINDTLITWPVVYHSRPPLSFPWKPVVAAVTYVVLT